jgi:hypothetical protein
MHGAGAAKMDAITRQLRASGRLPLGGRGKNAPRISAKNAAAIVLALAGSSTGAKADARLEKLASLPRCNGNSPMDLLEALAECLEDPNALDQLVEVRVARTRRSATFVYKNQPDVRFGRPNAAEHAAKFYVEGILPAELLREIAAALNPAADNIDLGPRTEDLGIGP